MDDVTRALERAAECACGFLYGRGPCDCADGVCGDDRSKAIARAAVLAFLKAMPAHRHKVSLGNGGYVYAPDGWNLRTLAAAIEEAQG